MTVLAVASAVQGTAALAAAIAAAAVLVVSDRVLRARLSALAAVLAGVALYTVVDEQVRDAVDGRAALALAAVGIGMIGLAAGAWLVRRHPLVLVIAAVVALPARIPLTVGGENASLLLPLYGVIAVGIVARLWQTPPPEPELPERGRLVLRLLAGVIVLYAAQALYSGDVEAAVKDVCFFYVPFALLLRLLLDVPWTPRITRRAVGSTVGIALLCAAVGVYQYATRTQLLANEKVLTVTELKPYFRVNSLFYDPNIYGRYLALAIVLVAAVLLWTRASRMFWLAAGAAGLLWVGLVPSLSQSSFAALAAGLAVLAALRWRAKPVLLTIGALAAIGVVVVLVAPSAVGIEGDSFKAFDKATSGRADLIKGGAELWRDKPILGVGSGGFAEEFRVRNNLLSERSPAESHTIPVTIAAEQGLVGLAAYLALLWGTLSLVLRGGGRSPARAAVAAAYAALVVHTLAYASFLEDPIAWALLAAAIALRRGADEAEAAEPEPAAVPA